MEFTCTKEDLILGVQSVERIVSTKSSLPIIGNILFETTKSGLKLSANNLEIGIEVSIPAKVSKEGSVLIPAKVLSGIASKLPGLNINFKVGDKSQVKISYKESVINVNGLPSDEFPVLPKIKEGRTFSLNSKKLSSMIEQTIFAASTSEEKFVLNGVLLEFGKADFGDNSNFRIVATDGYRLALRAEKIEGDLRGETKVIVPQRALLELGRIISDGGGEDVKATVSQEQISFKYKDYYLVSRVIQGDFPDYKKVIPKSSEIKVVAELKTLLEAAERTAVIAAGSANIVKFELKGNKLHLSANTPDVGSADEVVDVSIKGKTSLQIAFNIKLILDALKVIKGEKVQLEFSSSLSPGVIKPVDSYEYLYIVMPIRTSEASS